MTDALVVPVSIRVVVVEDRGGTSGREIELKVSRVHLTYQANGIPSAVVNLATVPNDLRVREGSQSWVDARVESDRFSDKGGILPSDSRPRFDRWFRLITGTVRSIGPGPSSPGSASMALTIEGMLGRLNTGCQRYSGFTPRTPNDPSQQMSFFRNSSFLRGLLDPEAFVEDPFNELLRLELAIILGREAVGADVGEAEEEVPTPFNQWLKATFGRLNTEAVEVLKSIRLPNFGFNVDILSDGVPSAREAESGAFGLPQSIRDYVAGIIASDWNSDTFLTRLLRIGREFYFGMTEIGSGILMVPWTPFVHSSNIRSEITAVQYSQISPLSRTSTPTAGFVLTVDSVGVDFLSPAQGQTPAANPDIIGKAALGSDRSRGSITMLPGPEWLKFSSSVPDSFSRNVAAVSTASAIEEGELVGETSVIGDRLAKFNLWAANWSVETLELTCPFFRTDIAPLNNVRVEISQDMIDNRRAVRPSLAVGQDQDIVPDAVYGVVDAVNIEIDAANGSASTTYRLAAVRYSDEQELIDANIETGEHPIWRGAWTGIALHQEISETLSTVNPRGPRGGTAGV